MRVCGFYEVGAVGDEPSSSEELDAWAALNRFAKACELKMRAKAKELGLDPNETFPEDLQLLEEDDKGNLQVVKDYKLAVNTLIEKRAGRDK